MSAVSLVHDLIYAAAAVAASPVWAPRMLRTGKWRTDWPSRFGRGETLPRTGRTLLIHAVSVGEVNAIRALVDHLAQRAPDLRIVIATTTDTGLARATQLYAERHAVVRYPLDFTGSVRRFLDRVQPDVVALTELEVWPNFVAHCARRSVPVCVINGRLSAHSFKGYRKIRPLLRSTFARLSAAAVQSEAYAERFRALGVPPERVRVLDTMKWDTAHVADTVDGADELAADMGIDRGRPLVVAGSTGPGEERLLIDACPPEAQLLLVPRKPERFDEVAQLVPGIVRRTAKRGDGGRIFLLDTMGELRKAYALASVVVVGRSFVKLGGSDPIEPIALGKPVIIGPHHANFADVVEAFRQRDGIVVIDQPGEAIAALLADADRAARLANAGREVILSRQGATRRHADLLLEFLPAPEREA